jgi:hypothetical protein
MGVDGKNSSGNLTLRPGLVSSSKLYTILHRMFRHMHGVLNVD